MVFGQVHDAVTDDASEGAEIAGIRFQLYIGQLVDQRIETLLEPGQDLTFASAVLVGGNDIVFGLLVQNLYHVPDNLRTLLQVSVNEGDIFAAGLGHTGVDTGFFAEITGEADDLDWATLCLEDLLQVVQGGIPAAIVDKDDLVIIAAAFKGADNGILEH